MINRLLGSVMWVAEERVDEYISAGHKLADTTPKTTKEKPKSKPKSAKKTK
jgi:hypothetical protein